MVAEPTPERLVERAQGGDPDAFAQLLEAQRERVRGFIVSRTRLHLGPRIDPEEILQDTFAAAFESIQRFRWQAGDAFFRWLCGIARHRLLKYVEGDTLAQVLGRIKDIEPDASTPFGPKDQIGYFGAIANAFADVADGLQHAHSRGVNHRDIKPSNLIFSRRAAEDPAPGAAREATARPLAESRGRLRILDFGLARLEGDESLTLSGDVLGTPLHMSPEQARRKKIPLDHRTDVYSLGATMYEALCGRPPFRGKDHADTLSQIIERDPVAPREVNPRVPKDLETILLKCLRKNASDRYGTAEALAQDLRRFVRGDSVEARPASFSSRACRWLRYRRPALSTLGPVIVAAIASPWLVPRLTDRERLDNAEALDVDTTLDLAHRIRSAGKLEESERLVSSMLARQPDFDALRLGYAELLAANGKKDRALRKVGEAFARSDLRSSFSAHVRLSEFLVWETARDLSPLESVLENEAIAAASSLGSAPR